MKSFVLPLLLIISAFSFSQYRFDVGGGLGISNYLGEMGGKEQTRRDFVSDLKIQQTRWAFTAFGRYRAHPKVSFKTSFTYGRIEGADSLSSNPGRVGRNLHFRNDLFELSATGEFYFLMMNDIGRAYRYTKDLRAYGFIGLAGLYHNPKANYQGEWVDLKPLKTEGQTKEYSNYQVSIPLGIGMCYTFQRCHRISWEMGWRTTFTDYLDDVSTVYADPADLSSPTAVSLANQSLKAFLENPGLPHPNNYAPGNKRGDPTHNDAYLFSTVTYSYVIKGNYVKRRYKDYFKWYKLYHKRKERARF